MTDTAPSPSSSPKLPPGNSGLPLLGETLAFAKDPFAFIHSRRERFGAVFRTNILGHDTAFISGPNVAAAWLNESLVERKGSMPHNLLQLFGGNADIVPLLDGEAHKNRKTALLAAFSREAIASYLPRLHERIDRLLEKWIAAKEGPVTADLKTLAIEALAGAIFGLEAGPELDKLLADNAILAKAFTALPIDLPWTAYHHGLEARRRILALLEEIVRNRINLPGEEGISRIVAAARERGTALDVPAVAREMHHFLLAGMIVYAELAATLRSLDENPEICERLRAEVLAQAPSGLIGPAQLRQMPYLAQVVDEVKRTCPNVPMSFGRARAPISLSGCTIPEGWLVMMAVYESNLDPIFTEPKKFDPDRFSPERDEKKRAPEAFMPQGAGELIQHKCAGFDFATVMMQLFTALVVRTCKWELPAQDLSLRWVVPPEHKNGLLVRFSART